MISSSASVAEIGMSPPDNDFPKVTISGLTPSQSHAKFFPALPIPVYTSSAIINTLFSLHNLLTSSKYPLTGTMTPFSPYIGSKMNAATLKSYNASSNALMSL